MNRDLMALPIDDIKFEDVQAFCAHQTPEHTRLDYKGTMISAKQIAKLASAYANTQGGMIIFGVEPDHVDKRLPIKSPFGGDLGTDPQQTIQNACAHAVFPAITPQVSHYLRNPSDTNKGFVIVRVAPSKDIHTIDGGKGIYVRVNDQSEPVQASLQQIELMMRRRDDVIKAQQERRSRALRIMYGALNVNHTPGIVEITLGPQLIHERLTNESFLRDNAARLSAKSQYSQWESIPVDSHYPISSMSNAVYCVRGPYDMFGDTAGSIDVYGNIALVARLSDAVSLGPMAASTFDLAKLPQKDGKHLTIEAAAIIERLFCVTGTAVSLYSAIGFDGLCDLEIHAPLVSGYPLIRKGEHGIGILGVCAPGAEVIARSIIAVLDLKQAPRSTLLPLVKDLLWAWSCTREQIPAQILADGEWYHTGVRPTVTPG